MAIAYCNLEYQNQDNLFMLTLTELKRQKFITMNWWETPLRMKLAKIMIIAIDNIESLGGKIQIILSIP